MILCQEVKKKMMITVKNNSRTTYYHTEKNKDAKGKTKLKNYVVEAFGIAEVPEYVAKIWFKTKNVVEYVKPEEAKAKQSELEKENAKLRAELEALKKAKPEEAKEQTPGAQSDDIEELKKEAEQLGIQFAPNIGAEKLKAKIEAKKAEQQ